MTDLRKAAEMALDAMLSEYSTGGENKYSPWDVIEALRQALAQPEQEPVAWKDKTYGNLHHQNFGNLIPLYAAPPKREWQELTDEDWHNLPTSNKQGCERDAEIFDWIEDKLKEKNT